MSQPVEEKSAEASEDKLRPYDARMLDVGDGHWIYVEEVGRADGIPALFLHGGPGSGSQHVHRALFDPKRFHAILFDQRGARAQPSVSVARGQHDAAPHRRHRTHPRASRHRALARRRRLVGLDARARLRTNTPRPRDWGSCCARSFSAQPRRSQWAFVDGPKLFRPDLYADFVGYAARSPSAPIRWPPTLPPRRSRSGGAGPRCAHLGRLRARASELTPGQSGCARGEPPTEAPAADAVHRRALHPQRFLPRARSAAARSRESSRASPATSCRAATISCARPRAAYALHEAWPDCRLEIIESAGHA